jgi:hypothetical protein
MEEASSGSAYRFTDAAKLGVLRPKGCLGALSAPNFSGGLLEHENSPPPPAQQRQSQLNSHRAHPILSKCNFDSSLSTSIIKAHQILQALVHTIFIHQK